MSGAGGELVGDGAGVAGHGGRVVVDLVEEQPQGLGDGGGAGGGEGDGDRGGGGGDGFGEGLGDGQVAGVVEGDGDRGGGVGDGSGEAPDDGLAGDGAVFVVVLQVGVEVNRESVLGVVREEPWTICRVRWLARSRARSRAGTLSRAAWVLASRRSAMVMFFWAAGMSLVFLSAAGMAGSRSMAARPAWARPRAASAARTASRAVLRAGIAGDLGVGPGGGDVVADLAGAVVL